MEKRNISIYIVPTSDFHESEYVGEHFKARAFITGFTGSTGIAAITATEAGLWTDGRYFVQAENQLKGTTVDLYKMDVEGYPTLMEFLEDKLQEGQILGFDGRVVNATWGKQLKELADKKHGQLYVEEDLVDLIHVSAGSYKYGFSITHPSMFREHGCNVYLAEEIKKHVSKPVATIGALNDPDMMEELIASGKVDIVVMGRALLADPQLPNKVAENRPEDIVRCLRCFVCMAERGATQTRRCSVNPLIGREWEGMEVVPARKKKKVLIAGGGVAGLQASITAAQRGHQVILCEKDDTLGGILRCEQAVDFKHEMYELGITLEHLAREEGVEIRLNTEVTADYAEKEHADALIIAVGSCPIVPPLQGIDGKQVVVVNDYYKEKEKVTADEIVVLGGGLAGCESAIHFAREGKKVHLVEMRDVLAPDANIRHRPILLKELEDQKVELHTGYKGLRITEEWVICEHAGEEVLVPGGNVICAVGQRARRDVVDGLLDSALVVKQIGDCIRPANICMAIYEGYHAALDI